MIDGYAGYTCKYISCRMLHEYVYANVVYLYTCISNFLVYFIIALYFVCLAKFRCQFLTLNKSNS